MAKKPNLKTITSGYAATTALNENFEALRDALDNTVSRDGSVPNTMSADLDLNGNDIINASRILVDGTDYLADALAAKVAAEAAQTNAELAEANAESAEDNAVAQATIATTAATNASTSATNAALSALDAESSSVDAQAAQTAAEAAQAAAEAVDVVTDAAIGTVSSLTEGSSATASATALDGTVTFDFGIPVGATGSQGDTGLGFTGGSYNASTGVVTFTSDDGLGFSTGDLRGADGEGSGDLISTNNLSDLADAATARTNLGLGTAATTASTDYATAAHTHSIEDLSDVASMTPAEGQALVYSSGSWTSADMSGGIAYVRKTANYTASANEGVIADTSGGAFTVTLPATPSTGDTVMVVDGNDWSTTNLTVARNGSTIEGDAEDMTMDLGGASVQFTYDGTTWQIYTQAGVISLDFSLDGGFAGSVYTPEQTVNGGSA